MSNKITDTSGSEHAAYGFCVCVCVCFYTKAVESDCWMAINIESKKLRQFIRKIATANQNETKILLGFHVLGTTTKFMRLIDWEELKQDNNNHDNTKIVFTNENKESLWKWDDLPKRREQQTKIKSPTHQSLERHKLEFSHVLLKKRKMMNVIEK